MRKLFALLLVAATASANEQSYRSLQSGSPTGATPLHDRGLHGEGQIIAILDTGADYDICYFAEANGSVPPFNMGTPTGGLSWQNVNVSRRKIIAYDFLYSCQQFPGARGCDDPLIAPEIAFDNQGHGTHAAATAAGDSSRPIAHDYADSIASGAKLVIQDAGYIGGDLCSQRPGIGCPVNLTPILDQAYRQGARIHSNSWGDRQGSAAVTPPTANYPASARDVDAFVHSHPDMLVLFNTGNLGQNAIPPPSTLSAPGSAKNTIQVGGTRSATRGDDIITSFSLIGPTRDGRIKPDLVGPAYVVAGDAKVVTSGRTCVTTSQPGTSWSSPTLAGAAALVRQYYTDGFYPSGAARTTDRFTPSAALLKATLIAAARPLLLRETPSGAQTALPVPSNEQGFGFPVLDDALFFTGDRIATRVFDVPTTLGLAQGESTTLRIAAKPGTPLRAVLVWTDPPGVARAGTTDSTPQLVNDLDLSITGSTGATTYPNRLSQPDRLNNVEGVRIDAPLAGTYSITVRANRLGLGPKQSYALVVTGDLAEPTPPPRSRAVRR
jgi:hypothetical protein